jgi:pantetheine-phosphate adenylyltransferase
MSREQYSYVSSSLVRQIAMYGGDISHLVPSPIGKALKEAFVNRTVRQEL